MSKPLSVMMTEAELVELHDLAARRRAHYQYVLGRLRDGAAGILAGSVDSDEAKRTLERIEAQCVQSESAATGEVFAFREALGRRPPRRRLEATNA